ncbi:hypothetical protein BH09PLA1_BH09PLA1_30630 [soil metagenome]
MDRTKLTLSGLLSLAMLTGACHHDKPHEYGRQRPPVEDLDPRDRGLQSKDVVVASDQMAQDLLALPELNESQHQWTIVVDRVENRTTGNRFDMNIFLYRLKNNLARYGRGRVALIENKARYRDVQSRELEGEREGDEFGQGGGGGKSAPGPAGIQPDFGLYARITEMPNRGTSYYFCEFTLTNLKTRQQVWNNAYEVKVAR